jgi:hypothetical protein
VANNCSAEWCATARGEKAGWLADTEKLCGTDALKKANAIRCKVLSNNLEAIVKLNCNF